VVWHRPELALSIFRTIEASLRPLLENLTHLVWNHTIFDITPFLGSKLSRIYIATKPSYIPSLIDSLKTFAPLLNNIEFSITQWPQKKLSPAIIDFIHSLQTLHCLKLTGSFITPDYLAHLSGLPHLRMLYITLDTSHGHTQSRSLLRDNSFPALREFGICTSSWTIAIDIFAAYMRHLPLQTVEMEVERVPSQIEVTRLLDTILDCCLPDSLRRLVFRPDDIGKADADEILPCVLDPPAIRRFFAFPNMEVLRISAAISFDDIDDDLIKDMVSKWPRLKELELLYYRGFGVDVHSKVTLYGLLPLADSPHFTSLTIHLNATIPPAKIILRPDGSFHNGALSHLAVGYSPIGDSVAVASFLSNVFPNLMDIEAWDNIHGYVNPLEEGSAPMLWQQVVSFYQPFVNIRKQERDLAVRTQQLK
jgi:hypothetical protein